MQTNYFFKLIFTFLVIVLFTQCTSDSDLEFIDIDNNLNSQAITKASTLSVDRKIILGRKLENPYSLTNMRKAFNSIKNKYRGFENVSMNIYANYYYVRVLPKDESELDLLKDLGYELYEHPLDREIIQDGSYYVDPEIGEDKINWQYFVMPVNYKRNGINYEILSALHLPEESNLKSNTAGDTPITILNTFKKTEFIVTYKTNYDFDGYTLNDFMEDESLYLTNNLDAIEKTEYDTKKAKFIATKRSRWRPSGTLKVNDDIAGIVPVVGAKGMATKWFKRGQGITDANGNWSSSKKFRGSVRYKIKWDRYHYSIRRGQIFQANLRRNGRLRGYWEETIDSNKRDKYHAMIHQAAHDYYYGPRFGLERPWTNSFFKTQMKIAARPIGGNSSALHPLRAFGIWPYVSIREYDAQSDKIYAVTAHELAHAAHFALTPIVYNDLSIRAFNFLNEDNNARRLMESWAEGIEVLFALQRYNTQFGDSGYEYNRNHQRQSIAGFPIYTSLVYDLIDDDDQSDRFGSSYPKDRVKGYTIKQIQDALPLAVNWTAWGNAIVNNYNNIVPSSMLVNCFVIGKGVVVS